MIFKRFPYLVEILTALALVAAPYVLPHLGLSPSTVNRILIWGLFGLGFDILFGFTGLLSFGQSAFFGTGGMVAAYLLTQTSLTNVVVALIAGTLAAAFVGLLVGLIALRRTGIYFSMITVAIAEVFYFVEFNPLSDYTGGENGLPGVPPPSLDLGFKTFTFDSNFGMYGFFATCFLIGFILARRIVRSPVGAILRAIRDNPLRAAAVGHDIQRYKLAAFVVAAAYAGFAGGLLGLMQGFMPPDAFTFDTSGQLVMQTAIGGAGTLFGPLVGAAIWLFASDYFQNTLHLGSDWKLVLGVVFVVLVVFLRHGVIGGLVDLVAIASGRRKHEAPESDPNAPAQVYAPREAALAHTAPALGKTILETRKLTRRYGGLIANKDIDFSVREGELRGVIGPNGAGKSTFFKMLTCETKPSSGQILFHGADIAGMNVSRVCQLGLTKSYQVNQLFTRLTARENVVIAALAQKRGRFRVDMLRNVMSVPGLKAQVAEALALVNLTHRADVPVSELAYGEKRRLEIGLALATKPTLLLLDEPLAGMSPRERIETVALLKALRVGRTLIVIDHDMDAIFELTERITVLSQGQILVEGTPEEIKANAVVQEAYLGGVHAP
jgi:branched-chain amino acid transport system permease protein